MRSEITMGPACAHSFGYSFDQFVLVKFRLTFGWTLSLTYWGVPGKAVVFFLYHTTYGSMQL